jgi:hypothetical protein
MRKKRHTAEQIIAKLADEALVSVLRPKSAPSSEIDLSRGCPAGPQPPSEPLISKEKVASPTIAVLAAS